MHLPFRRVLPLVVGVPQNLVDAILEGLRIHLRLLLLLLVDFLQKSGLLSCFNTYLPIVRLIWIRQVEARAVMYTTECS